MLNCPRGTIATRLTRARERLHSRLIQRGVTLSAGTLAAMFTDNALSAALPSLLSAQTAKIVLSGAMPVSITTLAEGVLHVMFMTKLKMTIAVILVVSVMSGAGVCTYYLHGQNPSPEETTPRPKLSEKTTPDKIAPVKTAEPLQKLRVCSKRGYLPIMMYEPQTIPF